MRKFLKVLSVILILFLVYNVVWAVLILPKYKGFKDAVGYDDQRKIWYCREGDYTYGVSAPGYLSFTGNLSVSAVVKVDKDGEMKNESDCSIIIWPKINGEYEFGVSIGVRNEENKKLITNYEFIIDEEMQPIETLADEEKQIFDENIESVVEMCKLAKEKWSELPFVFEQE